MVAQSVFRKEYGYLKPGTIHGDYDKKELLKFISEGMIWLEKSLTEEDKKDNRIIWALVKNIINPEWDQILMQ